MVGTKHCCWGECKSDSRYPDKLPKQLQEMISDGRKAFIPFPKPSQGLEKCQRWIQACSRENFTVENINRSTYICVLHWPGGKGPTQEFPDPLKANFSKREIEKAMSAKRPKPRWRTADTVGFEPQRKRKLFDETDDMDCDSLSSALGQEAEAEGPCVRVDMHGNTCAKPGHTDTATQTEYSKYLLSAKIDTILLKNEVALLKIGQTMSTVVSSISFEAISNNSELMKHFVGLTAPQFEALHNFLDSVCPLDSLVYWNSNKGQRTENGSGKSGKESKFSTREKLFICLLRLKRGFTVKTMAVLLSSDDRTVKETTIKKFFTTYIQVMYKIFRDMETIMFPTRDQMRGSLPKVFKTLKNIRCIVDCTEFRVEMSRDFAQQGNTYSSYKHTNTFKCLIGVTPHGGACFVSDLFEGDIDDVKIFEDSGIMKHIRPNDLILADRGFTVQHLLNPLQATVKIPSFLKGREHLTVVEELSMRKIAKARIHVERFNKRLKQFALVGRKIPLSLSPLATQMVVVACGLVNFQSNLCT